MTSDNQRFSRRAAHSTDAASRGSSAGRTQQGTRVRISLGTALASENANFYMLLGSTLFLTVFGIVMVLSSSTVSSFAGGEGSMFSVVMRQAVIAVIAVPVMLIVSRLKERHLKSVAWIGLAVACAIQVLTFTAFGTETGENRSWISIGPINFQPAELVKLALVLWLAFMISRKQNLLSSWRHVFLSLGPSVAVATVLVLLGGDLGTTMVIGAIIIAAMFFGGVPLRMIGAIFLIAIPIVAATVLSGSSRVQRITCFFTNECTVDQMHQTQMSEFALANGGLFGVGLGNSEAKWNWLPTADSDFIFAVIGEELGLVGALAIIAVYVVMGWALLRICVAAPTTFGRVIAGSVFGWIMFQTLVNIAVVLGLLPVLGVPLPLISSGGSALLTTLIGIGLALGVARQSGHAKATAPEGKASKVRRSSRRHAKELEKI